MTPLAPPWPREEALDALRGLAVLGMVLSGAMGFGAAAELPGWMYHAQLPPPTHKLQPTLPGLRWVDLVFPMFLFALGAAIPLALHAASTAACLRTALRRGALLLGFALLTQHFKAWQLAASPGPAEQALSILAFLLLGLTLTRRVPLALRGAALLATGLLAVLLPFRDGSGFSPLRNDIILVVLAVMATAGTLLWAFTRRWPLARWLLLPGVVAVMLAPADSWTPQLTWTPAAWAYQFAFLKYLLIVVPGLCVGEWLLARRGATPTRDAGLGALALALVLLNLTLLYARETALNALLSCLLLAWGACARSVRAALPHAPGGWRRCCCWACC